MHCAPRNHRPHSGSQALLVFGLLLVLGCSKKAEEPPASKLDQASKIVATPETCKECMNRTACTKIADPCAGFAEASDKALCESVTQCITSSNCADGKQTFTSCFCGSLPTMKCAEAPKAGAGAPDGACADVIRKGLKGENSENKEVLTRFTRRAFPGGAAIALLNCQKENGCGVHCGF